jgi:hypothetical protein
MSTFAYIEDVSISEKLQEEAQIEADACREHFPEELQDNLEEHLRNKDEFYSSSKESC